MKNYIKPLIFFSALVLVFFGYAEYILKPASEKSAAQGAARAKESREKQLQKMNEEIAKGPKLTVHNTAYGEVIHMRIPAKTSDVITRAEWMDCIVWRDLQLARVSISCPAEADLSKVDFGDMEYGETPSGLPSRYQ